MSSLQFAIRIRDISPEVIPSPKAAALSRASAIAVMEGLIFAFGDLTLLAKVHVPVAEVAGLNAVAAALVVFGMWLIYTRHTNLGVRVTDQGLIFYERAFSLRLALGRNLGWDEIESVSLANRRWVTFESGFAPLYLPIQQAIPVLRDSRFPRDISIPDDLKARLDAAGKS